MPWGNRTGPEGFGPRTGRGLGYCSGYDRPGYMNDLAPRRGFGRGYGYGAGFGRGYGRGFGAGYGYGGSVYGYPPVDYTNYNYSSENETEYLKNTANALEKELKDIQARLKEISDKGDQE